MTGLLTSYSLSAGLMLTLLTAVYLLTVRRVRSAWLQRSVILFIFAASLLTPFVVALLPDRGAADAAGAIEVGFPIEVSEGEGAGVRMSATIASIDWLKVLTCVVSGGMGVVVLLSLPGWWRLIRTIARGRKRRLGAWRLVLTPGGAAYSWGRWIVCPKDDFMRYGRMIITHESAHLRRMHWLDLLLAQAVATLMWWNPASWLLSEYLRDAHEFTADAATLSSGTAKLDYIRMLMEKAVGKRVQVFANNLNHSQLKRRITMMKNAKESAWRRMAALAMLPAVAAGVALAAMPQVRGWLDSFTPEEEAATVGKVTQIYSDRSKNEPAKAEEITVAAFSEVKTAKKEETKEAEKPRTATSAELAQQFVYIVDGKEMSHLDASKISPKDIKSMRIDKSDDTPKVFITTFAPGEERKPMESSGEFPAIAQYKGGQQALMAAVQANCKYPEEAKKKGVQGRAVVKMTISDKGQVIATKVLKSAGDPLLDVEAERVCRELNDWEVNLPAGETTEFVMPVSFKLF